jgi:hypothetical protein
MEVDMKFKQLGIALSLACIHFASHAISNGFDPETAPVIHPAYTSIQTDLWKLVGSVSGISAIQITPYWILASRHATPPQGSTFVNKYGQAVVGSSCSPAPGPYVVGGDNDVSLCRLVTPINIPNNASFPALSGVADGDLPRAIDFNHWGELLTVGMSGGVRRAAWVQMSGMWVGFDPFNITVDPVNSNALMLPVPATSAGGDSGGGAFLFPVDAPQNGILVGVLTAGPGLLGDSPTYLSRANVNWVTTTIAGHGDTPPTTVLVEQLVGDASARTPRNMQADSVVAAITGATTASVSWPAPPADAANPTPITRYLTRLQGVGEATARISTRANPGTQYYTGLTEGTRYQACVLTGGAIGYGPNAKLVLHPPTQWMVYRPGCTSFVAGAPNPVTIDQNWDIVKNPSTGKTDVFGSWFAGTPNGVSVSSYVVTIKVWANSGAYGTNSPAIRITTIQTPNMNFYASNISSGKEFACWTVMARTASLVTSAPTANQCFLPMP